MIVLQQQATGKPNVLIDLYFFSVLVVHDNSYGPKNNVGSINIRETR